MPTNHLDSDLSKGSSFTLSKIQFMKYKTYNTIYKKNAKSFGLSKKFLQELHRLQSDEDGSQGKINARILISSSSANQWRERFDEKGGRWCGRQV